MQKFDQVREALAQLLLELDKKDSEIVSIGELIHQLKDARESPLSAILVMKIIKHENCNDELLGALLNDLPAADRVVVLSYVMSEPTRVSSGLLKFIAAKFSGMKFGESAAQCLAGRSCRKIELQSCHNN